MLSPRRALPPLFLLALSWCRLLPPGEARAQGPPAPAQDRVVFKTGEQQLGRVLGVKDGQVQIEITTGTAAGRLAFPLERVARVDAPAPAGFATGMAALEAGDFERALAALRPVAENFRGLPTDWARQASASLGDVYIEKKDLARAEAAYADLRKSYGGSVAGDAAASARASVGQARLLLAKKDVAGARQLLEPLAAAALKDPVKVPRTEAGAYAQTFLLLGQVREGAGEFPAALEDYLRAATLFAQDRAVTAAAQRNADALRAAHPGLIAP